MPGRLRSAAGWEQPDFSAEMMRDRSTTPSGKSTGRPYTTQGLLAQVFDASYVRLDGGGWKQKDDLRVQTAGETELDRYWKSRKLVKTTISASSRKRLIDKLPTAPEHLSHWEELDDLKEFMLWCKSYSERYRALPVKKWRVEQVFSFVADSFQDAAQVDVTGKPLPKAVIEGDGSVESRIDTLVLRSILKHKLDYRYFVRHPLLQHCWPPPSQQHPVALELWNDGRCFHTTAER